MINKEYYAVIKISVKTIEMKTCLQFNGKRKHRIQNGMYSIIAICKSH